MSEETLFRIGGYYRRNDRKVVKLTAKVDPYHKVLWAERLHGQVIAQMEDCEFEGYSVGYVSLLTGRYVLDEDGTHPQSLLPGELHNVNGSWLPIEQTRPQHEPASCEEEKPALSLGAILRQVLERQKTVPALNTTEAERKRAPLPYFTEAKRFDAFPGYEVTSDCAYESQPNTCFAGLTLDGCGSFVLPKQAF